MMNGHDWISHAVHIYVVVCMPVLQLTLACHTCTYGYHPIFFIRNKSQHDIQHALVFYISLTSFLLTLKLFL